MRRRRARERACATCERAVDKGYFVAPDARAAARSSTRCATMPRFQDAAGARGSRPRSARWPRSATPAASGCSAAERCAREEPGPPGRPGRDLRAAARRSVPTARGAGAACPRTRWCATSATPSTWRSAASRSARSGPLQRTFVKWMALYAPLRWPPGIPTSPEIDQLLAHCTVPDRFDADLSRGGAAGRTAGPAAHLRVAPSPHLRTALCGRPGSAGVICTPTITCVSSASRNRGRTRAAQKLTYF